jgi:hypothetical protein
MRLTPVQRTALISIVDRFDRTVHDARARWAGGVEVSEFDRRTLYALANRGLVKIGARECGSDEPRMRKRLQVILFAAPTDLGRAEAT